MPTIASSHFIIVLPTLFAVTVFISVTGGLLLIFAWMQNRRRPRGQHYGAMWGGARWLSRRCS